MRKFLIGIFAMLAMSFTSVATSGQSAQAASCWTSINYTNESALGTCYRSATGHRQYRIRIACRWRGNGVTYSLAGNYANAYGTSIATQYSQARCYAGSDIYNAVMIIY